MRRPTRLHLESLEARIVLAHETLGTALPFAITGTMPAQVSGLLADSNSVQIYSLALIAGDRVDLRVAGARGLDAGLRVFDARGQQLALSDDTTTKNRNPDLNFAAPATATYYLGVSSFRNFDYDPRRAGTSLDGRSQGAFTLFAQRQPGNDVHDTLGLAIPVVLNDHGAARFSETLHVRSEVRLYAFTLDVGERMKVAIEAHSDANPLDTGVRIFDAVGRELRNVDDRGDNRDPSLTFEATVAGVYYAGVSSFANFQYDPRQPGTGRGGDSTGNYLLRFQQLPAGAAHDTRASALPVNFDSGGNAIDVAELIDVDEVRLYAIQLQAGQRLTVDVDAEVLGSELDSGLVLFNAVGTKLNSRDDRDGKDPRLFYDVVATGIYYVGVSSYDHFDYTIDVPDSGSGGESVGAYTVRFTRSTSRPIEREAADLAGANDTLGTAEILAGASNLLGVLAAGDTDVYRLEVDVGGRLGAMVAPATGSRIDPRLTLLRADGQILIQSDDRAPGDLAAAFNQHLLPGVYYLVVALQTASSTPVEQRGYRLTTNFEQAIQPLAPIDLISAGYDVRVDDVNEDGRPDLIVASGGLDVFVQLESGSFVRSQRLPSSGEPIHLALGDVDGDGHLDAVTVERSSKSFLLYKGNGDGTFRPSVVIATADFPAGVLLVDLDRDGRVDLVGLDGRDAELFVQLGRGDGTFVPLRSFRVGDDPVDLLAADVNGDGRLDVVTVNRTSVDLSILLGNGDGTFRPQSRLVTHTGSPTLAAGDLDGNGTIDLVVADETQSVVSVFAGDGQGHFGLHATWTVDERPKGVVVADFNHDGRLDIATGNYGGRDVSVLRNRGQATFLPVANFNTDGTCASVTAADLDGDGHLDLVSSNYSGDLSILPGRGDATFRTQPRFTTGPSPFKAIVGDFNGDGRLDVAAANEGSDDVGVLLGRGDGTFLAARRFAVGNAPFVLTTGDFNRDGRLDIATANNDGNTVSVLLGLGDGTFAPHKVFATSKDPWDLIAGDFTGDGILDLVSSNKDDHSLTLLVGRGDGTFRPGIRIAMPGTPDKIISLPVHGQRAQDIVVAPDSGDTLWRLHRQTNGTFHLDQIFADTSSISDLRVGDINRDRIPDLIIADIDNDDITILLGKRNGTFGDPQKTSTNLDLISVVVGDYTGDALLDVVAVDQDGVVANVYPGNGDGTFGEAIEATLHKDGYRGAGGDFNGDGRLDLMLPNPDGNDVSILLGQGGGQLLEVVPTSGVSVQHRPLFADLTGDGHRDSIILDRAGRLLFRRGSTSGFAPFMVVNPGQAARDVVLLPSRSSLTLAAIDAAGDRVVRYAWNGSRFVRSILFRTGRLPVRLGAADLDGDGRSDLVAACAFDDSVQIAMQTVDGRFSVRSRATVGASPSSITFADLDGQFGFEVLVTGQTSGDVAVLFNDAGHRFLRQQRYRAGDDLWGMQSTPIGNVVRGRLETVSSVAGDFTGDGRVDVLTLNRGEQRVSLLAGLAGGGLSNPVPITGITTTQRPAQMASADVDRDGRADLAILMLDTQELWVWRSLGGGIFAPPVVSRAGGLPSGFTLGDQNGDGRLDVLVGNEFGDILTLLGNGQGGFAEDRTGRQDVPLAVTDLNGDGLADVVLASQARDRVSVQFRRPGTNAFAAPVPIDTGRTGALLAPGAVRLIDLDGDGRRDLIVAAGGSNAVLVYAGLAGGRFAAPASFPVGFDPAGVTAADLDGDGILDLITPNRGSNDVSVLLGHTGPAGWTGSSGVRLNSGGEAPLDVTVRDRNGDGIPDLLVTNASGQIAMLPGIGSAGRGTGFFRDARPVLATLGQAITEFLPGSGGSPDYVVRSDGGVSVFDGTTFFSVFAMPGRPVEALARASTGGQLVAAFDDGMVGLLSIGGEGTLELGRELSTGGIPSALEVLLRANGLDIFVTLTGSETAVLLSIDFLPAITDPGTAVVVRPEPTRGVDLTLLATVLLIQATSAGPDVTETPASEEMLASLAPGLLVASRETRTRSGGGDDEEAGVQETLPDQERAKHSPGWEEFHLGIDEGLQRVRDKLKQASEAEEALLPAPIAEPVPRPDVREVTEEPFSVSEEPTAPTRQIRDSQEEPASIPEDLAVPTSLIRDSQPDVADLLSPALLAVGAGLVARRVRKRQWLTLLGDLAQGWKRRGRCKLF